MSADTDDHRFTDTISRNVSVQSAIQKFDGSSKPKPRLASSRSVESWNVPKQSPQATIIKTDKTSSAAEQPSLGNLPQKSSPAATVTAELSSKPPGHIRRTTQVVEINPRPPVEEPLTIQTTNDTYAEIRKPPKLGHLRQKSADQALLPARSSSRPDLTRPTVASNSRTSSGSNSPSTRHPDSRGPPRNAITRANTTVVPLNRQMSSESRESSKGSGHSGSSSPSSRGSPRSSVQYVPRGTRLSGERSSRSSPLSTVTSGVALIRKTTVRSPQNTVAQQPREARERPVQPRRATQVVDTRPKTSPDPTVNMRNNVQLGRSTTFMDRPVSAYYSFDEPSKPSQRPPPLSAEQQDFVRPSEDEEWANVKTIVFGEQQKNPPQPVTIKPARMGVRHEVGLIVELFVSP